MAKGKMSVYREYGFWCARCDRTGEFPYPIAREAQEEARAKGWRKIREEGWVCPSCLMAERMEAEAKAEQLQEKKQEVKDGR